MYPEVCTQYFLINSSVMMTLVHNILVYIHIIYTLYIYIYIYIYIVHIPSNPLTTNMHTANFVIQRMVILDHILKQLTACLYYRSNCTKSICFESIWLQEHVYTSGAESDQFDLSLIRGTAFTRIVRITWLLIRSSSIRFAFTLWAKSNQFESIWICILV